VANEIFAVTKRIFALLLIFATASGGVFGMEPPTSKAGAGDILVVPLKGGVSDAQFLFLRRVIKSAEKQEAAAVVLDMDTPGGTLQGAEKIVQLLTQLSIPTYTYINPNAGSAGALIALSTDHIYMAPVSAVGAAAIVMGGGQEVPETMNEKMTSYYSAYFRSVAEQKGHNPELVDAFIDKDSELKIGDEVISPEGDLLSLSPQEATEIIDGKPVLADGIAKDVQQLVDEAGIDGRLVYEDPSGFEQAAMIITMLAPLFLLGGIIGTYIEFKAPGFGVAGVVAAICFTLFFAGHYVAGLTGYEVIVVFALGLVLVLLELFLFPGIIFLATTGAALMLGAMLFAMVDYFPGQPVIPSAEMLIMPMVNLSIALLLSIVAISLLARYFPEMPIFRGIILAASTAGGVSMPATEVKTAPPRYEVPVGAMGQALSDLRPAGRAMLGGREVDVVTDGSYIEEGDPIRVVEAAPGRVVVAPERG